MQSDIEAERAPSRRFRFRWPPLPAWLGPLSSFSLRPAAVGAALVAAFASALEQRRVALLVPFAIISGCLVYVELPDEPALPALLALAGFVAAAHAFAMWRGHMSVVLVLCAAGALGMALLPVHGALFGSPMLRGSSYGIYRAVVTNVLSRTDEGTRLVIGDITPVDGRDLPIRQARLFVRSGPSMAPGDVIEGPIRFAEVPGPAVPGGYDAQFQSYFDGIGSYATATRSPEVIVSARPGAFSLQGLRMTIGTHIDNGLQEPARGIARALIIGDQSRIDDEVRATMAAAGLAHILAISGLHLTLVAGAAFAAVRLILALFPSLSLRIPNKQAAALVGIGMAFAYLLISGASVSAIRATIMLTLVFGAVLVNRQALTMRNVAIAAIIVLVLDPSSLFRPSFQLSFAAVAALIGVYEMRRDPRDEQPGWLTRAWRLTLGIALTSLVAGLATAIFAAYHFQQAAPLGVLGNIAALPIASFVVLPMGLLSVLLIPFGLDPWTFAVMGWGIGLILAIASPIAAASEGLVTTPLLAPASLLIASLAIGWFSFFNSRLRFAGPLLAIPAIAVFATASPPDILIADRTLGIAVRTGHGLVMVTGRATSFAAMVWAETYGEEIAQKDEAVACDDLGCIAILSQGGAVAAIRSPAAFAEDCDAGVLVVARIRVPSWCAGRAQVIGPNEIRSGGTLALRRNRNGAYDIEAAIPDPGRPWRVPSR